MIDLRAVEEYANLPIFGHLGVDVFKDIELVVDYPAQEITLYSLTNRGRRLQEREVHQQPLIAASVGFSGPLPVVEMRYGDQALYLGLDTGAGVNVLDRRRAKKIEARLETPSFVRLAPVRCPPMRTAVLSLSAYNLQLDASSIDGLLGFEFLKEYRVGINFRRGEIRLWDAETARRQYLAMKK